MLMGLDASLLVVGMSHRTAPVEVRERLAMGESEVRRRLAELRSASICDEALLLSTCNRVELYAIPAGGDIERIADYFREFRLPTGQSIDPYLYWHRGHKAVLHLFRVASSLDSLVVGEPQILGQVRSAVKTAEESDALGRVLRPLSRQCLSVAKKVRSTTDIGKSRVGIGNVGVDLAMHIFGSLTDKRAMLIGTGEMGQQVARALRNAGLDELVVTNRTFERAVEVASDHAGTAIAFERMGEYLSRVDVVIAASGADRPIVERRQVRQAIKSRRYRPLFLVDLSVPRNIDPQVAHLDEAFLFNIDDLVQVMERGKQARAQASAEAQRLVEEEASRFSVSMADVEIGPRIGKLVQHVETLRALEVDKSRRLVSQLDAEGLKDLDAMTRALVKKVLAEPLRAIREAARTGQIDKAEALLRALGIEEEER